jgi:hypothetical protein
MLRYAAVIGLVGLFSFQQEPPREWIEATGHRVVRLSDAPGTASPYFHQNPYTATGDKMVVSTREGLATIELATRTIMPLVEPSSVPKPPRRISLKASRFRPHSAPGISTVLTSSKNSSRV